MSFSSCDPYANLGDHPSKTCKQIQRCESPVKTNVLTMVLKSTRKKTRDPCATVVGRYPAPAGMYKTL